MLRSENVLVFVAAMLVWVGVMYLGYTEVIVPLKSSLADGLANIIVSHRI